MQRGESVKYRIRFRHMDVNILGFMPALLPVALSPGASFTLAISSALAGGRKGLVKTLTGTALGIFTHALLIGMGITAVIVSSPAMFSALQMAGTLYLLWLGAMLIRSGITAKQHQAQPAALTFTVTVRQAFLANVLNPKAILFYLTVVSRFTGSQGGVVNYLALASVHVAVMALWLSILSYTLVFSAKKADPLWLKTWVNLTGGIILILYSLHSLLG